MLKSNPDLRLQWCEIDVQVIYFKFPAIFHPIEIKDRTTFFMHNLVFHIRQEL